VEPKSQDHRKKVRASGKQLLGYVLWYVLIWCTNLVAAGQPSSEAQPLPSPRQFQYLSTLQSESSVSSQSWHAASAAVNSTTTHISSDCGTFQPGASWSIHGVSAGYGRCHTLPSPVDGSVTIYKVSLCSFLSLVFLSSDTLHSQRRPVLPTTISHSRTFLLSTSSTHLTLLYQLFAVTTMFGFTLYQSACVYASVTAFSATWVALALPIQHGKAGPFNYHRAIKKGGRIPWRRIPGMKI
jgi:hypothetical protein